MSALDFDLVERESDRQGWRPHMIPCHTAGPTETWQEKTRPSYPSYFIPPFIIPTMFLLRPLADAGPGTMEACRPELQPIGTASAAQYRRTVHTGITALRAVPTHCYYYHRDPIPGFGINFLAGQQGSIKKKKI